MLHFQDEADRDSIAETDSDRDRGEAKGRGGDMETSLGGLEAGGERGHTMGSGAINLSSSRPNSVPTLQHNEAGEHDVSSYVDIDWRRNKPLSLSPASHLSCVC